MDNITSVRIFASLAQESRLGLFRLLVQAGPEGLSAGNIAERLSLPSSTLSFHLKELAQAGLVQPRQVGRFIYYSADFTTMNALIAFLTENCCDGQPEACCSPFIPVKENKS